MLIIRLLLGRFGAVIVKVLIAVSLVLVLFLGGVVYEKQRAKIKSLEAYKATADRVSRTPLASTRSDALKWLSKTGQLR